MELPSLPTQLRADPTLSRLDDDRAQAVLQLAARLGQAAKWPGTAFHAVLARWLETGLTMEADLRDWLREQVPVIAVAFGVALPATNAGDGARFDQALRHADEWRRQGWSVYHWKTGECPPPGDSINACPQVLFGRGEVLSDRCSVALFNSRKPRRFHCQEPWLAALRDVLAAVAALPIRLVSSRGTISYDLVSCFAEIRGVPLGLVATDEVFSEGDWAKPAIVAVTTGDPQPASGRGWSEDSIILTCALHPVVCPKPRRMVCRDRLLAHLADLHVVLAVRDQGNLLGILRAQQQYQPRWQWILEHSEESESMRGNRVLVKEFPEWYHLLMVPSATGSARLFPNNPRALAGTTKDEIPPNPPLAKGGRGDFDLNGGKPVPSASTPAESAPGFGKESPRIAWDCYLYHYTRACPGPWPGQSEFEYLTSVLEAELTCGHSALDTLLRILAEGRIRGSHRLVRGLEAVISWTSRPPQELAAIRHWNRTLGRWTFEPYGIAVNRQWLRNLGAKPAIYGADAVFERLPRHERFRFQVGDSIRALWRREREWRLLGDLQLDPSMDVLVLVPDAAAMERIAGEVTFPYRVAVP